MGVLGKFTVKQRRRGGKVALRSVPPRDAPEKVGSEVVLGKGVLSEKEKFDLCAGLECKFIEAAPTSMCYEPMFTQGTQAIRLASIRHCKRWGPEKVAQEYREGELLEDVRFKAEGMDLTIPAGTVVKIFPWEEMEDFYVIEYEGDAFSVEKSKIKIVTGPQPLDVHVEAAKPAKVIEIADAIRRDNPGISDESAYRMAWKTYCTDIDPGYEGCKGGYPQAPPATSEKKAQAEIGFDDTVELMGDLEVTGNGTGDAEHQSGKFVIPAGATGIVEGLEIDDAVVDFGNIGIHIVRLEDLSLVSKKAQGKRVTAAHLARGIISAWGGPPMSGLWTISFEDGSEVHIESGFGARQLVSAFGEENIVGQDIYYSVDELGVLEAFTSASEWTGDPLVVGETTEVDVEAKKVFAQDHASGFPGYTQEDVAALSDKDLLTLHDAAQEWMGAESDPVEKQRLSAIYQILLDEAKKRDLAIVARHHEKKVFAQDEIDHAIQGLEDEALDSLTRKVEEGDRFYDVGEGLHFVIGAVVGDDFSGTWVTGVYSGLVFNGKVSVLLGEVDEGNIERTARTIFAQVAPLSSLIEAQGKFTDEDVLNQIEVEFVEKWVEVGVEIAPGEVRGIVIPGGTRGRLLIRGPLVTVKLGESYSWKEVLVDEDKVRRVGWVAKEDLKAGDKVVLLEDIFFKEQLFQKEGTELVIADDDTLHFGRPIVRAPDGEEFTVSMDQIGKIAQVPEGGLYQRWKGELVEEIVWPPDSTVPGGAVTVPAGTVLTVTNETENYYTVWHPGHGVVPGLTDLTLLVKKDKIRRIAQAENDYEVIIKAQYTIPVKAMDDEDAIGKARGIWDSWSSPGADSEVIEEATISEVYEPPRKGAQVPEDEIKPPTPPPDRTPGGFSKNMSWEEVQEHELHSDLYDSIEEAQNDLSRFEMTHGVTPAIVFCYDEEKYAIVASLSAKKEE